MDAAYLITTLWSFLFLFISFLSLSLSIYVYMWLIPWPIDIGEERIAPSDIFLLSLSGTRRWVGGGKRERLLNAISRPSRPCFYCSRRLSRVNPEILSWMTLYPVANVPFLRTPVVIAAILITPRARGIISSDVNAKAL